MIDAENIKKQFPIFRSAQNGQPLVYLDSAATTQKPQVVIDKLVEFYSTHNANIHRGAYTLSEIATDLYEQTRLKTAKFINAKSEKEIIFTKNTTESINLIAYTWGENNIKEGDEIILTPLEHHSNLIPWQILAAKKGAKLKFAKLTEDYQIDQKHYATLFNERTKLVCLTGMSNVTGSILPIKKLTEIAHQHQALVLIDGAQSVPHLPTDVQDLNCDFLAFSSHKMLGPTGVGVCYIKSEILENLPPFITGGGMILSATESEAKYLPAPERFEAGTPAIAEIIAFQSALDFLQEIGMEKVLEHDKYLLQKAKEMLSKYPEVKTFSPKENAGGVLSFTVEGIHPHDLSSIFSSEGVCIRSGQHCAHPLMQILETPATARMSFYLYNTENDLITAEKALQKSLKIFKI